jgi:hypothetical protein
MSKAEAAAVKDPPKGARVDTELERYRELLQPPTEFKDGFGWTAVAGVLFCGLIMIPGSIYLGLMTGGNMGSAAQWVTVILFSEVMRRAMKSLSKQELVVLLYAAGAMTGGAFIAGLFIPGGAFGQLIFRAFFVRSDAVRDAGMRDSLPHWWVPGPDSAAITERNLLHPDWFWPIALLVSLIIIGLVNRYTLGYFFFRLTSDVERLPFPMAPIQAQGAMALAEADKPADEAGQDAPEDLIRRRGGAKKKTDRWRLFSLGISMGILFGLIQVGVPAISGLFLDKPLFLLPLPFFDATTLTESILPATPTGVTIDLAVVLVAMVIPFWAVVGSFIAIVLTMVLNPILHSSGVLTHWQPGMDTVNTAYSNNIDFWLSFGIGTGLGIAVVSIFQTVRDIRRKIKEHRKQREAFREEERRDLWEPPIKGRGDWPIWLALLGYVVMSIITITISYSLLPKNITLLAFLIFFAFVYNPLISYVNARLLGIAGQTVDIPFVRETSFILSGAQGVAIWLAPIPIENYGGQAQAFRVTELTGVSFRSLVKLDLVVVPVSLLLSFVFWAFIWSSEAIPSAAFPAAQLNFELASKNHALLLSSTHILPGQTESRIMDSQFIQAIHPEFIGAGVGFTILLFAALSTFGAPVMLVYGVIRGFGGLPQTMLLEIVGALIGRYYFQKKFGADEFLRMIPTVVAGYFTGVGLIGMATIAMRLIQSAVSAAPF